MILVTGASGFVGSAVARQLAQAGEQVRVLVRSTSSRVNLADPRLEIVQGDLRDAASLERAMQNVRVLFHVAADYRLWARDDNEIIRTNVEGTRALMEAAKRAGVERIVYTSSVATLKAQPDGTPSDETSRLEPQSAVGAYKYSKVVAERLVEQMVGRTQSLPAVIVNPSTPIGPGDVRPTPTGRIIVEAASGRMPAFVDTGLNLVHVEDVAAGHIAAWKKGRIGERYILGGQDVRLGDMLAEIARQIGRAPPKLRLPRRAHFSDCLWRRSDRLFHRQGAVCHHDRLEARQGSDVLHLGQGRARTRLSRAALWPRRSPTPSPGSGRTAT